MNASGTGEKGALTPPCLGAIDASNLNGDGGVRVCVCACVYARASVSACVHDVFAIDDNNISPRLIMIIIKIIILHFIHFIYKLL